MAETAFPELRDAARRLRADLPRVADYFHALALCEAYDYMASLAKTRIQNHPEVIRAPALGKYLLMHFKTYPDEHIDLSKNQIFNEQTIGNVGSLRDWQHRAYPIKRTTRNYPIRLKKWIAIYDETDFVVESRIRNPRTRRKQIDRVKNPSATDASGALDFDAPSTGWTTQTVNTGRVRDKEGNVVTYNTVIEKRNRITGDYWLVASAPFWLTLNYGTAARREIALGTGPAGYPIVGGLHFREDGEMRVPDFIAKYSKYLDDFALSVLVGKIRRADLLMAAHDWAKRRVPKGDIINIPNIAKRISFMPF